MAALGLPVTDQSSQGQVELSTLPESCSSDAAEGGATAVAVPSARLVSRGVVVCMDRGGSAPAHGPARSAGRLAWLQRSIRVRNPYIDPMNYAQVALRRRLRGSPGADEEAIHAAVRLSVNGIAAGLRNTG